MSSVTVIKLGGSLGKNVKAIERFYNQLAVMAKKESVVLVHGGGPKVTEILGKFGIKSRFINGLRYTDAKTLEVVEMVLSGSVNKEIVSRLNKRGVRAAGISGKDGRLTLSRRIKRLGFVGEPKKVDVSILKALIGAGYMPVVSSLSIDEKGQTLNVNSDSMAMALAISLKAKRLILLTNVPGVLDSNKKTIKCMHVKDVALLIKKGIITGGMIPKIKACASSIQKGVNEVWIACGVRGLGKLQGTILKR